MDEQEITQSCQIDTEGRRGGWAQMTTADASAAMQRPDTVAFDLPRTP